MTLYQACFLEFLKVRGGLFGSRRKNCYKSCLLHPNHLKLGITHIWTLTKILTLVTWSKCWRHRCFWLGHYSTTNIFCLTFKFFLWLKSTVSFFLKSSNLKRLLDVLLHIFDDISNIQNTWKAVNNTFSIFSKTRPQP